MRLSFNIISSPVEAPDAARGTMPPRSFLVLLLGLVGAGVGPGCSRCPGCCRIWTR
ncbi:hypothetical protein ACN28S_27265 [Cystobacter fuscus]